VIHLIITKKKYIHGSLVEVLEPSPDRTTPPCPYYGSCGGCDLQHIKTEKQTDLKNDMLREHMIRSGIISAKDSYLLHPPIPPEKSFGYRQRIRLHVDDSGRLGYHYHHSHETTPVGSCLLAVPRINDVLAKVLKTDQLTHLVQQKITNIEFQYSQFDDQVVLLCTAQKKQRAADIQAAQQLVDHIEGIKALIFTPKGFQTQAVTAGDRLFSEGVQLGCIQDTGEDIPLRLQFEAGGFCQVNQDQNAQLIALLMQWTALSGKERVLDLYCGMGNFSLALAQKGGEVVGVDLKRASIRSAKKNAAANHIAHCHFIQKSAGEAIKEYANAEEQFDLVLLDPPRQGCKEVIPYLPDIGAQYVVYISCDPATLSRDLSLIKEYGYRIMKMQMIDMFPQTHHMETIVELMRVPHL